MRRTLLQTADPGIAVAKDAIQLLRHTLLQTADPAIAVAKGKVISEHLYSLKRRVWKSEPEVRPQGAESIMGVSPNSSPAWMTVLPWNTSRQCSAIDSLLASKSSG